MSSHFPHGFNSLLFSYTKVHCPVSSWTPAPREVGKHISLANWQIGHVNYLLGPSSFSVGLHLFEVSKLLWSFSPWQEVNWIKSHRWALPHFLGVTPACENLLAHTAVYVKRFDHLRSKPCLWTSAPLAKLVFHFSSIIPLFSHSLGSEQSGKSKWTSNASL